MAELHLPHALSFRMRTVTALRGSQASEEHDAVAEEVPVAIEFNGVSHVVMMATPADLEDFACGFAITEGVVSCMGEIFDIECLAGAQGYTVQVHIAAERFARLKDMRRNMTGRTGCGLCGTESLEQAVRAVTPVVLTSAFSAQAIRNAIEHLAGEQALLEATGTTHAAAWCDGHGNIRLLREDIGRHNALDKLIGAIARQGLPADAGFIAITSRASYEMAQKCAVAGVGVLAAVSGVTGLAIDVAQQAGLTLAGFVRGSNVSVYTHPGRIVLESQ